jgi:hypothetical protein
MISPGAKVIAMPLPRARAGDLVRGIVDAGRWSITVQRIGLGPKATLVSRHIEAVLQGGWIEDEHAEVDEHGNYRFRMVRLVAGLSVRIEVAMQAAAALPRLFVIGATGEGLED